MCWYYFNLICCKKNFFECSLSNKKYVFLNYFPPVLFVFKGFCCVNAEVRGGERQKERGNDTKTFGICRALWSQEQKRRIGAHTETHKHTQTPCDLSIIAVVTPSHSLWLFDHNLPPTPKLHSNWNFQKIILARQKKKMTFSKIPQMFCFILFFPDEGLSWQVNVFGRFREFVCLQKCFEMDTWWLSLESGNISHYLFVKCRFTGHLGCLNKESRHV